jgi:hypothetical protein
MQINGTAIYKTRMYTVYGESNGIRYTQSKDHHILNVFVPPHSDSTIQLDHVPYKSGMTATLLGSQTKISIRSNHGKLELSGIPSIWNLSSYPCVIQIKQTTRKQ